VVPPFRLFSSLEELLSSPYDITLQRNSAYQSDFEQATGIFQELWLNNFSDRNKSLKIFQGKFPSLLFILSMLNMLALNQQGT
jgi:hypothetical protein